MALLDDIRALPAELLATRDTAAIAAALSAGRTRLGTVSRAWFATWAAGNGMRAVMQDVAATQAHPLRSIALACLDVLAGAADGIDLALPENQSMVQAWVTAGAMPQADADTLYALAAQPDPLDEMDVRRACWSDEGVWQA